MKIVEMQHASMMWAIFECTYPAFCLFFLFVTEADFENIRKKYSHTLAIV